MLAKWYCGRVNDDDADYDMESQFLLGERHKAGEVGGAGDVDSADIWRGDRGVGTGLGIRGGRGFKLRSAPDGALPLERRLQVRRHPSTRPLGEDEGGIVVLSQHLQGTNSERNGLLFIS